MGSKHSALPNIYTVLKNLEFKTALDAFSGSGAVSYLLKTMGKSVTSNDFLNFCYHVSNACVTNNNIRLTTQETENILKPHHSPSDLIARTFRGIYFTDEENAFLDNAVSNIREIECSYKQSIAFSSLTRACLRRRPRGIFTYTGVRYDDGRRDLQISFEQHFRNAVELFNDAVFDNKEKNEALNLNIFDLSVNNSYDLVYFDPPYVSPLSDNDYTRRYHFVEGLTRYWKGLEILEQTLTKKFRRIPSLFDTKKTIHEAFLKLFERHRNSIIVVSYSSNSFPAKEELTAMLKQFKSKVKVHKFDHLYSFGTHQHKVGDNKNKVSEYLFVGT